MGFMIMISIEEMQSMLDNIAAEFPAEFFKELNGGIILLPEVKRHEKSVGDDLFVLGEYNRGGSMGRYITIYYGSFIKVYGNLAGDRISEKLRSTVRHEFRHHIESLAGTDDLDRIDRKYIADYQTGRDYEDEDDADWDDDDDEDVDDEDYDNGDYDDEYGDELIDDDYDDADEPGSNGEEDA
jgi:hypothetical protein